MENDTIILRLGQTAASVLENAAFIFLEEEGDHTPLEKFSFTGGTIDFLGPFCGNVTLWMVNETIDIIARNLLCIDEEEEVSTQQLTDALKEMLNMITGNLLTTLFDENLVFNLGIPHIIEEVPDVARSNQVIMYADAIPVILSITMK